MLNEIVNSLKVCPISLPDAGIILVENGDPAMSLLANFMNTW